MSPHPHDILAQSQLVTGPPPSKASLKAWWKQFTSAQKKKEAAAQAAASQEKGNVVYCALYVVVGLVLIAMRCRESTTCVWGSVKGESALCQCADLDCKYEWRVVCVGIYTRCCGEMVCILDYALAFVRSLTMQLQWSVFKRER